MVDNLESENPEDEGSLRGRGRDIITGGKDDLLDFADIDDDLSEVLNQGAEANILARSGEVPDAPARDLSPEDLDFGLPSDVVTDGEETPGGGVSSGGISSSKPEPPTRDVFAPEVISVGDGDLNLDDLLTEPIDPTPNIDDPTTPGDLAPPLQSGESGGVIGSPPSDVLTRPGRFEGENVFIGGTIEEAPIRVDLPLPGIATDRGIGALSRAAFDPFERSLQRTERASADSDLPPDPMLEEFFLTEQRVQRLWDEINDTYDIAINDVRGHFEVTEQAVRDLKKAREYLLAGRENYDNAEAIVNEVKARLRLEEKVRQWTATRATWLGAYLVAWFLILSAITLFLPRLVNTASNYVYPWMAATIIPALLGVFGGVVGAMWILIKHTAIKRDFDPIHTTWYLSNPLLGGALAVITFYVVYFGGAVLAAGLTISNGAGEGLNATIPGQPIFYPLYVIVGFRQNLLWSLIDRFLKAFQLDGAAREPQDESSTSGVS